jgi:protein TonB
MSSASLAVPRHAHVHPDSVRIAALSGAIAINLAALLAVMRPAAAPWIAQVQQHMPEMTVRWMSPPPKPEVVPTPAIELKPLLQPKAAPHPRVLPHPVSPPVATATDEGSVASTPAVLGPASPEPQSSPTPEEATLAYRAVPLAYPPVALRTRMQGTVVLKVLVDEQGVPQEVAIEQSSGYALLDRSAREQVKNWRFEPATAHGQAVRTWARVPVTFSINQL